MDFMLKFGPFKTSDLSATITLVVGNISIGFKRLLIAFASAKVGLPIISFIGYI